MTKYNNIMGYHSGEFIVTVRFASFWCTYETSCVLESVFFL